ncbi:MAG: 5-formyltetrahydrofolate cyclo-ligase [Phocaeicola sp.]|uniref:5-formyltetrahydrofolate cyclo-ligase n=1 Tax=Phocaeicola TaxID=909656 RepID=UPI00234EAF21|nr:5-formyltetrahydrofolate cyclo-ligase [Phocaeicola oris]MCE2615669.1 5-formyltetrahydrofolate cyclo-ligase [Phocaeicola oris]
MDKKELRKQIALEKKKHEAAELKKKSVTLLSALEQSERFQSAKTILLYYSLPDEVYTHDFISQWYTKKNILLPVVKGNDLELRKYTGPDSLHLGAFHIEEPEGEPFVDYRQIDIAIIPGISFDAYGHRLGRGRGYYDRLLLKLSTYNIGICFSFQVCAKVPTEAFDKTMDEVWTENGRL